MTQADFVFGEYCGHTYQRLSTGLSTSSMAAARLMPILTCTARDECEEQLWVGVSRRGEGEIVKSLREKAFVIMDETILSLHDSSKQNCQARYLFAAT